jgi:hypothetical protein
MTATHKTASSKISVHYPEAWEGTVTGRTVSGGITFADSLQVISDDEGWGYRELVAGKGVSRKGEGSSVEMASVSGELTYMVGDDV